MSAGKVDVLAVMDASKFGGCNCGSKRCSRNALDRHIDEARAAVAELIEADKEYDKAKRIFDRRDEVVLELSVKELAQVHSNYEEAVMRRIAALAHIGGAP